MAVYLANTELSEIFLTSNASIFDRVDNTGQGDKLTRGKEACARKGSEGLQLRRVGQDKKRKNGSKGFQRVTLMEEEKLEGEFEVTLKNPKKKKKNR